MFCHQYTPEQIEWLKQHRPNMLSDVLADKFNATFGVQLTPKAIQQACIRRGIACQFDGRFVKGQKPWNTGKKAVNGKSSTVFKKGNTPQNVRPVGFERIRKDGYVQIKVAEGFKQFRQKQRVIWEQHHGPIPQNCVVIFLDGNKLNCSIENLVLVKRKELAVLNMYERFADSPPDIKKTQIQLVRLEQMIKQVKA